MTDIPAGWPCADLPDTPPSVTDRLSTPGAGDILPQLLQLTPRGPVWGTDEAGSGRGANPVMLQFWTAVAGHAAANYATHFDIATQCFPSAITWSLQDWEAEYGLPDDCFAGTGGTDQRIAAVRARFGALGGQSPAYFVCLARSIGYTISIDEPTQFLCDTSECGSDALVEGWFICDANACSPDSLQETWFVCDDGQCDGDLLEAFALTPDIDADNTDRLESFAMQPDLDRANLDDEVSDETTWKYWVVKIGSVRETWFTIDDGECAWDPLSGFVTADDLECEFRRLCPPHTELIFDYSALSAGAGSAPPSVTFDTTTITFDSTSFTFDRAA